MVINMNEARQAAIEQLTALLAALFVGNIGIFGLGLLISRFTQNKGNIQPLFQFLRLLIRNAVYS
jgi:hypothetical protein